MSLNLDLESLRYGKELVKRGFARMQKGGVIMDVVNAEQAAIAENAGCLLYTSPSPRDRTRSRMPSSA